MKVYIVHTGTANSWNVTNIVIPIYDPNSHQDYIVALESDTGKYKIPDGVSLYKDLPYFDGICIRMGKDKVILSPLADAELRKLADKVLAEYVRTLEDRLIKTEKRLDLAMEHLTKITGPIED